MDAMRLISARAGALALALALVLAPGLSQAQSISPTMATSGISSDSEAELFDDAPEGPELETIAATARPMLDPDLLAEEQISPLAPQASLRPEMRDSWIVPAARWDEHPDGARWTAAVLSALRGPGAPLLDVVPRDIQAWCPGYPAATPEQRAAFWTGLISSLAWHESTHRPTAVGGGGRWFGLVQIAPGTARWRSCDVQSGQALLDGAANLRCGIRIMAITVPRDGVVSEGMRGVAADWGPFHSSRKREDMRNWVRGQDYCQRQPSSLRPVMRPVRAADVVVEAGSVDAEPAATDAGPRPIPRPEDI